MKNLVKLHILFLVCVLAFGCANKQKTATLDTPDMMAQDESFYSDGNQKERYRKLYPTALERKSNAKLMRTAHSALGTPYVRGGDDPSGFDCSGFVQWTYKSVGVDLPRTAREQSVIGQRINNVNEMKAGDIVAFRHPKRGYHTGIYVGDGKFIHSPRKRTRVRINELTDPYFSNTFLGARRVALDGNENLVAQAESRLASDTITNTRATKGKKSSRSKELRRGKGKVSVIASNEKSTKIGKKSDIKSSKRKNSGKSSVSKSKKMSRGTAHASSGKIKKSQSKGKSRTSASIESNKKSSSKASSRRG